MRCRACDTLMLTNPMYRRTKDGHKVINDLCTYCSFIADNPDLADIANDLPMIEDDTLIQAIVNQHIKIDPSV